MNWYVGQPVLVIKDHSQGLISRGQEFIIRAIATAPCGCVVLCVGIKSSHTTSQCQRHMSVAKKVIAGTVEFSERMFAPLDVDISELIDVLATQDNKVVLALTPDNQ